MHNFLKEYFCFSRGEKNGTIVLCTIMFLVFLVPWVYDNVRRPADYQPDPGFINEVRAFYGLTENDSIFPENHYRQVLTTGIPAEEPDRDERPDNEFQLHGTEKVDVNSADTATLIKIRGLGQVLSRRILKYRGILGGYYDVSQLLEVYGIDEDRFRGIEPCIYADTSLIVKLRPATDEFGILLRHPYLDYEQVSEIFRIRGTGKIDSLHDLLLSPAFSEDDLKKLMPYVIFD
ncbi:MAG: helix-hairpin-helix domain-containing protein [Bacteroidales bacterium]